MKIHETLVRNTLWFGLLTVAGLVSGLLMSVILARGLGPTLMGQYSYLLWAARTITAMVALGFTIAVVRYTADALARGDAPLAGGFVHLLLRWQIVATSVGALVLVPLAFLEADPDLRWAFVVVIVMLFVTTLEAVYGHALQGAQRYDLTTRASTVKMVLELVACATALWFGAGLLGLVLATSIGTIVACLLKRRHARRVYPTPRRPVPDEARAALRAYLIPISLASILETLVWDRSEVFFLRVWAPAQDIAFYSLAFGLSSRALVLADVAGGALLPAFAALHGRGDRQEFIRVYRTAMRYVALAGAPIAALIVALAEPIITLLYGTAYLPVARLLQVLVVVSVVGSMRQIAWTALRAVGEQRTALLATAVSAAVDLALAAVLIPYWSTTGAVVANSAAQLVGAVWAFVIMARRHDCAFPFTALARIAAVALLAIATSSTLVSQSAGLTGLVAAGAAGIATFVGGSFAARVLGTREIGTLVASTRRVLAAPPTRA